MIVLQGKLMDPRIFMKVLISNAGEAESLVACAMTRRATAMTNANSTSRCCDSLLIFFLKKVFCLADGRYLIIWFVIESIMVSLENGTISLYFMVVVLSSSRCALMVANMRCLHSHDKRQDVGEIQDLA